MRSVVLKPPTFQRRVHPDPAAVPPPHRHRSEPALPRRPELPREGPEEGVVHAPTRDRTVDTHPTRSRRPLLHRHRHEQILRRQILRRQILRRQILRRHQSSDRTLPPGRAPARHPPADAHPAHRIVADAHRPEGPHRRRQQPPLRRIPTQPPARQRAARTHPARVTRTGVHRHERALRRHRRTAGNLTAHLFLTGLDDTEHPTAPTPALHLAARPQPATTISTHTDRHEPARLHHAPALLHHATIAPPRRPRHRRGRPGRRHRDTRRRRRHLRTPRQHVRNPRRHPRRRRRSRHRGTGGRVTAGNPRPAARARRRRQTDDQRDTADSSAPRNHGSRSPSAPTRTAIRRAGLIGVVQ